MGDFMIKSLSVELEVDLDKIEIAISNLGYSEIVEFILSVDNSVADIELTTMIYNEFKSILEKYKEDFGD